MTLVLLLIAQISDNDASFLAPDHGLGFSDIPRYRFTETGNTVGCLNQWKSGTYITDRKKPLASNFDSNNIIVFITADDPTIFKAKQTYFHGPCLKKCRPLKGVLEKYCLRVWMTSKSFPSEW